MCKEAHDRFEYPWPVSRSVSVGGRGNNRKSDTDYRRYRDFSLVIATPSDTITWTTGDYEYQVSLHIRCLRYDTARSFFPPLVNTVRNRFPEWKSYSSFLRMKDFHGGWGPLCRGKKNIYFKKGLRKMMKRDKGDFKKIWRRLKSKISLE